MGPILLEMSVLQVPLPSRQTSAILDTSSCVALATYEFPGACLECAYIQLHFH